MTGTEVGGIRIVLSSQMLQLFECKAAVAFVLARASRLRIRSEGCHAGPEDLILHLGTTEQRSKSEVYYSILQ